MTDNNYILVSCPLHEDLHPSLMLGPDQYKCLSCGATGKMSDVLQRAILIPSESSTDGLAAARRMADDSDTPNASLRYLVHSFAAALEQARSERDEMQEQRDTWYRLNDDAEKKLAALEAENQRLRAALEELVGKHDEDCISVFYEDRCDCGYNERAAKAAPALHPEESK